MSTASTRQLRTSPPHHDLVSHSLAHSGRRLGTAVLLYVLSIVLVVTLEPLDFHVPRHLASHLSLLWWVAPFDVVANVALFMIPGFLYALARQASRESAGTDEWRRSTLVRTIVASALFSGSIELAQLFEAERYPSFIDVLSNTAGGALGALLFLRIARLLRADTPVVGLFALELPLMGLFYLAVPLSLLSSLTLSHDPVLAGHAMLAAIGLLSLALFMGVLLGYVQRHRLAPRQLARPSRTALAAAGAFSVGALPALPFHPVLVLAGVGLSALSAWAAGALRLSSSSRAERRFESVALRRAAPPFLCYLLLAVLAVPAHALLTRTSILDDVESYSAFAVFGFMIAEWRGRLELRYRWVAAHAAAICFIVAGAAAYARNEGHFERELLAGAFIRAMAGAYGALIYHLQRTHVRTLAASQRGAEALPR